MLHLTNLGLAFALLALAATAATFVMVATRWQELPERIPRHFGFTGRPNAWSPRELIWVYPVSSLVFLIVMLVAQSAMPAQGKSKDADGLAASALLVSGIVLLITNRTIAVAEKRADGLGRFASLGLLAGTLALVLCLELVVN